MLKATLVRFIHPIFGNNIFLGTFTFYMGGFGLMFQGCRSRELKALQEASAVPVYRTRMPVPVRLRAATSSLAFAAASLAAIVAPP
jgi:hypothetical protein